MNAVYLKELSSYFKSARGYLCLGLYYLFGGQFLLMQIRYAGTHDIAAVFGNMYLVVLLTLPLLTMRLFSEEKRARTEQALFTAPVRLSSIVYGKYLAALTLYAGGIGIFIVYEAVLGSLSALDLPMFVGNFTGILLLGAVVLAIGLFVSALTESQMLAAAGTFGCMIMIFIFDGVRGLVPDTIPILPGLLEQISIGNRFTAFNAGAIRLTDVLFMLCAAIFFLFLTIRVLDRNRWTSSRRIQNRTYALLYTLLFAGILILTNAVAAKLTERMAPLDLTDQKLYRLSDASRELLGKLEDRVEVLVCAGEETLRGTRQGRLADELLKNYERSGKVDLRFVDLLKEPQVAAEYADWQVREGSVVVKSSKRIRVVSVSDFFETTSSGNGQEVWFSRTEQVLSSAVAYVTDSSLMQVSVLTGHKETGSEEILQYLRDNNYEVKEENISTQGISPDSEMAFLLAPMTDFTPEETARLDAYLDNGGKFGKRLFYAASYSQPALPVLEAFLAEWGISAGSGIVLEQESSNVYDEEGFLFSARFTDTAKRFLEAVKDPDLPVLAYYCRPLTVLWEEKNNRSAQALITSPEDCLLYMPDGSRTQEERQEVLAALGERVKYLGTEEVRSSVAVFSSLQMFSSSELVSRNFNNRDFAVALINQLNGKQADLSIDPVSLHAQELRISRSQYRLLSGVLGLLLPALLFLAGAGVTVYRRRL